MIGIIGANLPEETIQGSSQRDRVIPWVLIGAGVVMAILEAVNAFLYELTIPTASVSSGVLIALGLLFLGARSGRRRLEIGTAQP